MNLVSLRERHGSFGIAYLMRQGKVKRSLVALANEDTAKTFHKLKVKLEEEYEGDVEFEQAVSIAMDRLSQFDPDDDSVTVGFCDLTRSPVKKEEEAGADDITSPTNISANGPEALTVQLAVDSPTSSQTSSNRIELNFGLSSSQPSPSFDVKVDNETL